MKTLYAVKRGADETLMYQTYADDGTPRWGRYLEEATLYADPIEAFTECTNAEKKNDYVFVVRLSVDEEVVKMKVEAVQLYMQLSEYKRKITGCRCWIGVRQDVKDFFLIPMGIQGNALQQMRKDGIVTYAVTRRKYDELFRTVSLNYKVP